MVSGILMIRSIWEMRLLHKNGHYIPVLIRGSVGIDKDGMLVMYCVIVDISEQKRIIQELELEKERYDLLVQASNEIIFGCGRAAGAYCLVASVSQDFWL